RARGKSFRTCRAYALYAPFQIAPAAPFMRPDAGEYTSSATMARIRWRYSPNASLSRRTGEQIGVAVVDGGVLAPDRGIESGRQLRFELNVGQAGNTGIILVVAHATAWIADTGRIEVPI